MKPETATLLALDPLAAAVDSATAAMSFRIARVESLLLEMIFTRAGGGTSVDAWVQTSLDGGSTWVDIAQFSFLTTTASRVYNLTNAAVTSAVTPGNGALAANTSVNGILGGQFRVKYTTVGTYTGASSLYIYGTAK